MSSFGSTDDEASLLRSFYDASWTAGLTLISPVVVSLFLAFQPLRWLDRFFGRCSRSLILAWWSVGKVRSGA